jgi:predicted peptidase
MQTIKRRFTKLLAGRASSCPVYLQPVTLALLLSALAMPASYKAKAQPGTQSPQTFETSVARNVSLQYLLYLPADYDAKGGKVFPLMLFLHGAGERGTNLQKVAVHGPPKLIKQGTNFPFVVVSPQCPTNQRWHDDALLALLDSVCAKYKVDTNRLYVTGLSMGGFGSWSLAAKYPDRFAAAAPVCEVIDVLLASKRNQGAIRSLGVWAFHGAKDPVVPLAESQRMVDAFKRAGCQDVQLTVYPEATHDSWTESYNNPQLYEWFLKHSR